MSRPRSPSLPQIIKPSTPPLTPPPSATTSNASTTSYDAYSDVFGSLSSAQLAQEHNPIAAALEVPEHASPTKTDGLRTPTKPKRPAPSFLSPSDTTSLHESHLSPYGGSAYSSSLAESPYISPTAVRKAARSPAKARSEGMYCSPTASSTKAASSPIKSPERVQMSPKKKPAAAPQLGAPPPYSRYNTYTYSVKYQGQKSLGHGGPPFPSLLHNISTTTAPFSSSSKSTALPTPLPTPTGDAFAPEEKCDAFDSRPLSLSPFPSSSSTPKAFGVSHACYDPSPSRSSFGGSPFYFETKPKKPQPRPRVTSAPDNQAEGGQKGRNQAFELEACLAPPRPAARWNVSLPSFRRGFDVFADAPVRWRDMTDSGAFWMAMYFVFNLGLTLYNKGVLVRFPFPYTLTALHTFCGTVGTCWLWHTGYFTPARLTAKENVTLSFFSILYTLNIAISNVSLQLVTVPFHQVVRASAPIPTILITLALLGNRGRGFLGVGKSRLLSLAPVMLGVAFATYGDYYFTTWGLVLTLLGTFLAALKTVITNMLQTTTKSASGPETTFPTSPKTPHPLRITTARPTSATSSKMKLHPLDLLLRMSPLAFLQCMVYAYVSGELHGVHRQFSGLGDINMSQRRLWALLVNGCIAFGLNIVSFTANRKCGPLSMTVAANVKQVLTICLAVVIFDLHITATNGLGILLTLLGGMWFGAIEYQEKRAKSMFVAGETGANGEKMRLVSV